MTTPRSRIRRLGAALLVAVATVGALAACGDQPDAAIDDVVIVAGTHTGAPLIEADLIADALAPLDAEGDRLVVVTADGAPFVALDYTFPELPGNSGDREEWLEKFRDDASLAIQQSGAKTEEVDLAEALSLAADAFRSTSTVRTLTVLDSGLSTVGDLSMLDGRLYAEPVDLVTAVEQGGGIAELSSVRVRMPRLGVVSEPQPLLSEQARSALEAVIGEYFRRANATDVELEPLSLTAEPQTIEDLPHVTPVPIDRPSVSLAADCSQELGTSAIGFEAGSAELSDPVGARTLLEGVVAALASCEGSWTVDGSASSEGDAAENTRLSTERAETIRSIVATIAAVDEASIETRGWGVEWPCRVPDLDADGDLLLDAAIYNRTVVVGKGSAGC
jgi:outer membrane protein OmpA-like peptidoglycan-associated protein